MAASTRRPRAGRLHLAQLVECDDLTVVHQRLEPGACEAAHHHEYAFELVFVLEGALCVETPDGIHRVGKYQGYAVPPRTSHRLHNASVEVVELLLVASPSTCGDHLPAPDALSATRVAEREGASR